MTSPCHEKLLRDLAELKLHRIAELYQEMLNQAARNGTSMLHVLTAAAARCSTGIRFVLATVPLPTGVA